MAERDTMDKVIWDLFAMVGMAAIAVLAFLGMWVIANGIHEYETSKVKRNRRF